MFYYLTGNQDDVVAASSLGICLMGGGSDEPNALKWMIQRSDGGDFVVIRTSGGSGYNGYIFEDLGGVDSVMTLVIDSREKANSSEIEGVIKNAEALFIAGGDQTEYYDAWNETRLESAVHYLIRTKGVPVGGTSAGMAVLSDLSYIPRHLGVYSREALSDPYHQNMEDIKTDFLHPVFMNHCITDTHFSERDRDQNPPGRLGRTIGFLARIAADGLAGFQNARAIACDERTAVCVDGKGLARVFGNFPERDDYAFFFSCDSHPDICRAGQPLHWPDAVTVFRIPGTPDGTHTFDLVNWAASGGTPFSVNVNNGEISNDIQTPD